MPGSIEMPDIVNTLMLCDLTFNSFRAVRQEDLCVHPHSYDGAMAGCGRACSHEGGPSGGHGWSRRAPPGAFCSNATG